MEFGNVLDHKKMKSQSRTAINWLGRHNDYLDNISSTYNSASEIEMLGSTYKRLCQQCATYVEIIDVLKTANDCDKSDHEYLIALLEENLTYSEKYDDEIISHRNEYKQNADDEEVKCAADQAAAASTSDEAKRASLLSSAENHGRLAGNWRMAQYRMERYMGEYDNVNTITSELFTLGAEYRLVAKDGMESIAWNFDKNTNTYSENSNDWKGPLTELGEKAYTEFSKRIEIIAKYMSLDDACDLISKDAEDVTVQEYLALCTKFDGMTDDEMSKFIDSAYKEKEYWDALPMDYTSGGMYSDAKVQYTVSSAFIEFADIYIKKNNVNNDCNNGKKLYKANVLYIFSEITPDLYIHVDKDDKNYTKDLGIKLSYDENNKSGKVLISADPSMGATTHSQEYDINPYTDKLTGPINTTVKDDINDLGDLGTQYAVAGVQMVLGDLYGLSPEVAGETIPGVGVAFSGIDALKTYTEYKESVQKANRQCQWLDLSEALQDLEIYATVINRRDAGDYCFYLTNVKYDTNTVNSYIDDWNSKNPDRKIECTSGELVLSVLGKSDAVDQQLLKDFIEGIN